MTPFRTFITLLVCQIGIINSSASSIKDNETSNKRIKINNRAKMHQLSCQYMKQYLEDNFDKETYIKLDAVVLSKRDLQVMCALTFKRLHDLESLDRSGLSFLKSINFTVDRLMDAHALSFMSNLAFRSPKKTMRGKRIVISTPEARENKMTREGITLLKHCGILRSSQDLTQRSLTYDREEQDYKFYQDQFNSAIEREAQEQLSRAGHTRAQYKKTVTFEKINATAKFIKSYNKWIYGLHKDKIKITRDNARNYFLSNYSHLFDHVEIQVPDNKIKHSLKTLFVYYNPYDFDNNKYKAVKSLSLINLEKGMNPRDFEMHHLTMSQLHNDILIYLPSIFHTDSIHIWNTDINNIDRADFNKERFQVNMQIAAALKLL